MNNVFILQAAVVFYWLVQRIFSVHVNGSCRL